MPMSRSGSAPPQGAPTPPAGPPTALDALLADAAGDPLRRAQWLDALDRSLRPCLPPALAAHARLANVRDDRLVYLVDHPAWNARLRLAIPALLDAARSLGLGVAGVTIRTRQGPLPPAPGTTPAPPARARRPPALDTALALLRSDAPTAGAGGDRGPGRRRLRPVRPPEEGAS